MIRVNRGRKIVFNPVAYEQVEVFASITEEFPDETLGSVEKIVDSLSETFDEMLTTLLAEEITSVAAVTTNDKSIVHEYRFIEEEEK